MQAPETYSQWIEILECLKMRENDSQVLELMRNGKLKWQTGVLERFLKRLNEVIIYRLEKSMNKFQSRINNIASDKSLIDSILHMRKEIAFLYDVVNISSVPEKQRIEYIDILKEHSNNIQKSLESSAKNDRSGKMSSIVRNHRINNFKWSQYE